jgi:hypothetical protein
MERLNPHPSHETEARRLGHPEIQRRSFGWGSGGPAVNFQYKLSCGIERYNLSVMRLPIHALRAAVGSGLSIWLAVLACLMGCTLPSLASGGPVKASVARENSADQNSPDLMAGMENCPHHSGGNAPAKPNEPKPIRGGGMSCCPVEVTVAAKPATVTLDTAPSNDFVLAPDFTVAIIRFFHSVEFVPPVWHSGRDTLLETQLLRI